MSSSTTKSAFDMNQEEIEELSERINKLKARVVNAKKGEPKRTAMDDVNEEYKEVVGEPVKIEPPNLSGADGDEIENLTKYIQKLDAENDKTIEAGEAWLEEARAEIHKYAIQKVCELCDHIPNHETCPPCEVKKLEMCSKNGKYNLCSKFDLLRRCEYHCPNCN